MASALKLSEVSNRYGAPMGRRNELPDDIEAPITLTLERLKFVDGDYDEGGAYWGYVPGSAIFCAWNDCGVRLYTRADSATNAQLNFKELVPGATFLLGLYDQCDAFTKAYLEAMMWSSTLEPFGTCPGCHKPHQILCREDEDGDYVCEKCSDDQINNPPPVDDNYQIEDLSETLIAEAMEDCNKFQERFGDRIRAHDDISKTGEYHNLEMAGHDLWLTRVGSGAGFMDGDWEKPLASEMAEIAHRMGDLNVFVDDNGKLYTE